ncbi:hypothetical protein BP5796_09301 [Coleophoma crateriformis]|uniref:Uncharacterized protein n=1 Tax=Coleophoma crateriformis TaxID=565419 RepID=A0A3D8R4A1_9HELO|nr:hypothetical protein BP5796_09301 [Coleophoma crateriformis]
MQFTHILMAAATIFATAAVAGPSHPNLVPRDGTCSNGQGCLGATCCYSGGCCYACSEGSDAECSPEITERTIFAETV